MAFDLDDMTKLPDTVPVFPLEGVLLLPRGQVPLNIFEPRYLQMFDDALANGRLLGMVQPYDCLLYTSPSPRDRTRSRMPSSA